MFKKFRTISGDTQSTKHLYAEHLPSAQRNLPSQKLFYYSNFARTPLHILCLIAIFAIVGIMNMYSISLTTTPMYFHKFLMFWVFAMVPLYLAIIINLRYLLKFSYVIYTLSLIGLVAVFAVGDVSMGARRWIDLGFMKVQPSEFAKIGVVFAIARYYHFVKSFSSHKMIYAIGGFAFAVFPAFLTILQPDLGSGLVIASLACLMVFVNGIRWRWLLIAITGLMIALPFAWNQMHDYQKDRIFTFIDPEKDPKGAGYNVIQSKIAIGSGGFFGKGYLNNDQSALKFLPENQTDFAFTVFAEEFGFFGCVLFVSCFAYLIFYGSIVSLQCKNYFGKMLAFGVTSMLFIHICVNLSMIMGLLPVVGIPLPFVSYGGSSLLLCVFCLGILINIDINKNTVIQSSTTTFMYK